MQAQKCTRSARLVYQPMIKTATHFVSRFTVKFPIKTMAQFLIGLSGIIAKLMHFM